MPVAAIHATLALRIVSRYHGREPCFAQRKTELFRTKRSHRADADAHTSADEFLGSADGAVKG